MPIADRTYAYLFSRNGGNSFAVYAVGLDASDVAAHVARVKVANPRATVADNATVGKLRLGNQIWAWRAER